ncbi:RTA1 like protein-domain-containing protein [Xylariales sp. AK1849]|nr:RTA1 like protein-domain-containing protein [Xylariales sp. AK1849]
MAISNGTAVPAGFTFRNCKDYVDIYPELCQYDHSYYEYRIWLAPNAAFAGLFGLSLIGFLVVFAFTRRNVSFTVSLILGILCEIIGYAGRILSWENQWSENGFLIQICCLTIGPAFMAAGIYFCLKSIIYAFGQENSRIRPELYPRIFIPCDVISLILQAVGGGMASVASHNGTNITPGNNIMISGLAFQVSTLLVFMILAIDFGIRTLRRPSALDHDPVLVSLRASWRFRLFLSALSLSTFCIFWRSVFRVAELSDGWTGPIMKRQDLFVGFEGVMVVVAVLALNVFHPNLCFREMERFKSRGKGNGKSVSASSSGGEEGVLKQGS